MANTLSPRTSLVLPELGYGAANLGGLNRAISDDEAHEVLEAAWDAGIRYFDTAPHYGIGTSERRLGAFLQTKPRDEYVVSTKVGRLLVPNEDYDGQLDTAHDFYVPATLRRHWDASPAGIRQSLEESLERMGLDRIDLLYLHDPDRAEDPSRELASGTEGLAALKAEGLVSAIGLGSMSAATLAEGAASGALDALMVAGRLTLLEQPALADTIPACEKTGTGIVTASVFNSGLLARENPADNPRYEYGEAPTEILAKATRIAEITRSHGVPLPAAALQYTLRFAPVGSVVAGSSRPGQIRQNAEWMNLAIPEDLWAELAAEGLIP